MTKKSGWAREYTPEQEKEHEVQEAALCLMEGIMAGHCEFGWDLVKDVPVFRVIETGKVYGIHPVIIEFLVKQGFFNPDLTEIKMLARFEGRQQ